MAVMHASPGNVWNAPTDRATDESLSAPTGRKAAVSSCMVTYTFPSSGDFRASRLQNAGSVGLPYDGDPRASYWSLQTGPEIRRVDYDIEAEIRDRQQATETPIGLPRSSAPGPMRLPRNRVSGLLAFDSAASESILGRLPQLLSRVAGEVSPTLLESQRSAPLDDEHREVPGSMRASHWRLRKDCSVSRVL